MKQPRFLTPAEEERLAFRQPAPEPSLDSLIPFESIQISQGCMDLAERIGPFAEEVMGVAHEFYSEGFTRKGERPILDIFIPTQELTTPVYFEPTPNMILQLDNYLMQKRQSTKESWITIASIHGHGRAQVDGQEKVTFSLPDVLRHMTNFLEGSSLPTRRILGHASELSLMYNEYVIESVDGNLVISDGFAYHPVIEVIGLPFAEQQKILKKLGIDPSALGDKTTLDIIAAHLEQAAVLAEQQGKYALSAKQWNVLRYNYFIVFDNDKEHHAEIGILVENTVDGRRQMHRKEVSLETVVVENDVNYTDKWLRERIKTIYASQIAEIERQKSIKAVGTGNWLDDYHGLIFQKYGLLPDQRIEKTVFNGQINEREVVDLFFYSVLKYLSLGRYDANYNSQLLSDMFRVCITAPHLSLTYYFNSARVGNSSKDGNVVFLNQGFDHLKPQIVKSILDGLGDPPDRNLELQFMIDFAYAPTVKSQNEVINKYTHLFENHSFQRSPL